MVHKCIAVVLICALSNYFLACTSRKTVSVSGDEARQQTSEKIVAVITTTGHTYRFDDGGARYIASKQDSSFVIEGRLVNGTWIDLGVDSVLQVSMERVETNTVGTIIVVAVFALVVVGLIAAATAKDESPPPKTTHSCPFVYSNGGERFVFDAEPYGGAIAEGLKKTDFSRLEHLKPVHGKYGLLLRNETEETQYSDEIRLVVVDHAKGIEISPDYAGRMTAYRQTTRPLSVTDEHQHSLMNFFKERDDVQWESQLPADSTQIPSDLRHHLTFTFKKGSNARTMKFLVRAGTAWWGSNMIKKMLDLRGDQVNAWYEDINAHGLEYAKLLYFMEREELYMLKMNLWEGGSWTMRAVINGGGPLITEDRVITLDVSHVQGDSVTIRLNPPMGYWTIDYIGIIDQELPLSAPPVELSASLAEDHRGGELTSMLTMVDSNYYVMPEVGDWAKLEFNVPPQASGTDRSVYLKSTGFYELHLKKDGPQQSDLMTEFGLHPGRIVSYSLSQYLQWREAVMAQRQGPFLQRQR